MMNNMHNTTGGRWVATSLNWIGSLALALNLVTTAVADEAQMYFLAEVAPQGSLSASGAGELAVYLRWDGLNANLPGDIVSFELHRDGTLLDTLDAHTVMSTAQIQALYAGANQARRRLESTRWLNEQATLDINDPFGFVDETNFAQAIATRLMSDPFWAVFASRVDFNIARARHRGYLDTEASAGSHEYELFALSASGQSVRVGQSTVDTSLANAPLPAALNFMQISDYARCDAPEAYKEHGAVMLTWLPGSIGAADKFIESISVSGYDLYRSVDNTTTVPVLDLRALAGSVPHDSAGNLSLPGLEKLNDQPIIYSGEAEQESRNEGWNSPYAQYMQSAPEVAGDGLLPGDSRAYYLVARDFTGNYGATTGALVTIPDLAPPPPPWSVRVQRNEALDHFQLVWDHISVANYYTDYQNARTYCNLATARLEGKLRYVNEGESCDTAAQIPVELDVAGYVVYRFAQQQEAAEFSDADGDGFADAIERLPDALNPELSTPGTACSTAATKGGAWVADIPANAAITRPSGRRVIEFADDVPNLDRGTVYWYRIAALASNGNISTLSAPVRGFFPDREYPQRPTFDPGPNRVRFGVEACDYQVNVEPYLDDNQLSLPFAWDTTGGEAAYVRVSCEADGMEAIESWRVMSDNKSFILGYGFVETAEINAQVCSKLDACLGDSRLVEYYNGAGALLASETLDFQGSCPFTVDRSYLSKDCENGVITAWEPGEPTDGPLVLDYPTLASDECLNVYRDIGGEEVHLRSVCDPAELPLSVDLVGMHGGRVCLSVAIQNENNEVSTRQRLPCAVIESGLLPSPPQPLDITFDDGLPSGSLSLLPPQDPVTGSIVEWYWKGAVSGGQTRFTQFVPHAGQTASDGPQQSAIELTGVQVGSDWQEEWCFRARSVGSASADEGGFGALSAWSVERCALREPVAGPPAQYLPWPKVAAVPNLGEQPARYLSADFSPIVQVSRLDEAPCFDGNIIADCPSDTNGSCLNLPSAIPTGAVGACPDFCANVKSAVAADLGFVVYRQRSTDPADPGSYSDFAQNSPLIDKLHCITDYDANNGEINGGIGALLDPFLFMAQFDASDADWAGTRVFYVDRQPFAVGQWYRYQMVYLDVDGEVIGQKHTDWIEAANP